MLVVMMAGRLHVLLWHSFSSDPYPMVDFNVDEDIKALLELGLIERPTYEGSNPVGWTTTERGRAYVGMLLTTPLPEHRWVDPRTPL